MPEGRQTFAGLTVAENLELGGLLHRKRADGDIAKRMREVCERFPVLHGAAARRRRQFFRRPAPDARHRARPDGAARNCCVLDEPSLGLSPVLVAQIFQLIAGLRDRGTAILLSEQNARLSLAIADRGYVIENGRVAISGTGRELLQSNDIAERYLGVGADLGAANVSRDEHYTAKLRQLMSH